MVKGKGKGITKKSSTPYMGYGTNISAGKKITQQVKKNVRKGVVSAARKAGKEAAKGTGPKKYTKKQMENFGRGGRYLVDEAMSSSKAKKIVKAKNFNADTVIKSSHLAKILNPVARAVANAPGRVGNIDRNKVVPLKSTRYLTTKGTRKIGAKAQLESKNLYEREAAKAYANTKKRMGSKGKKK